MSDTPAAMTRHQVVLQRIESMTPGLSVAFSPGGAGDMTPRKADAVAQADALTAVENAPVDAADFVNLTHVALDAQVWRAMGEPDAITATIEPGDTLTETFSPGIGTVTDVNVVARGQGAVVGYTPEPVDDRPQHDDVTSDDVRQTQDG